MKKSVLISAFLMIFAFMSQFPAFAGYGWMLGCKGEIGFIRIPQAQTWTDNDDFVKLNGTKYHVEKNAFVFQNTGLPLVNSEAVLNVDIDLVESSEIPEVVKQYKMKSLDLIFNDVKKTATTPDYSGKYGVTLGCGFRVRILGYQSFPVDGGDALFALIQVITDEKIPPKE